MKYVSSSGSGGAEMYQYNDSNNDVVISWRINGNVWRNGIYQSNENDVVAAGGDSDMAA